MKNYLLLLAFLLAGLAANAQLQFVSSTPAANANTVARNADIVLNFNANVDAATVTVTNIIITGEQTGIIAGSFSGGGTSTITFNPTTDFKPGEVIRVVLTTGLTNTSAQALAQERTLEFRTASTQISLSGVYNKYIISDTANGASSVFAADMDGDGDVDALACSVNGDKFAWYENDGNLGFTRRIIDNAAVGAFWIYAADLDSDGDMDIVGASPSTNRILWYENDGNQNFTLHNIDTAALGAIRVRAVDMDGDGDMDVLGSSKFDDTIAWYENDGNQSFTKNIIDNLADNVRSVYAADMDGDGDMDVLGTIRADNMVAWYENDGSQGFTKIVIGHSNNLSSAYPADMDGDGDIDVLTASRGAGTIDWYENDGSQNFTAHHIDTSASGALQVYAADGDGDGDMDVLAVAYNSNDIIWYENGGSQNFTKDIMDDSSLNARTIYAADFDGDGDLDVLTGSLLDDTIAWYRFNIVGLELVSSTPVAHDNYLSRDANIVLTFDDDVAAATVNASNIVVTGEQTGIIAGSFSGGGSSTITFNPTTNFKPGEVIRVVLTTGLTSTSAEALVQEHTQEFRTAPREIIPSGTFTPNNISTLNGGNSVFAADMDGDGDMDVLGASGTFVWSENDGNQVFTTHIIDNTANGASWIYATDLDSDGDMDALGASGADDTVVWYENDGSQNFTLHNIDTAADGAVRVYAADIDGDGDMDVLGASKFDDTIAWYENDGSQNFTKNVIDNAANNVRSVYAADMDGDGDMDVLGTIRAANDVVWYENDGSQSFTKIIIDDIANLPHSAYPVDIDGDGDMDVVGASRNDDTIAWYENDGSQGFTKNNIDTSANGAIRIYPADMDGDGDMDVLGTLVNGNELIWYENDGNQNFTKGIIDNSAPNARSIYAADMDGDKDLDVLGTSTGVTTWYSFDVNNLTYIYDNNAWAPQDPNGVITAVDNAIVLSGTATFTQDVALQNLDISAGAALNVEQALTFNGDLINNGDIIFVCDYTQTKLGQLGPVAASSSISGSGTVTTQTCFPARRAFRFVSSAITTTTSIHDNWQEGASSSIDDPNPGFGTHITGSTTDQQNGFDVSVSGAPSLFLYDNTNQTWEPIANTDVNIIEAGTAYRLMVRGGRNVDLTDNATTSTNTILRANGDLVTGNYSNGDFSQVAGAFNFFGNPYQSIVDMNSVMANSINVNPNFYYVWDPTLGGAPTPGQPGGRGGYVTVSLPIGSNPSGSDANAFLQPGQAAFVTTAVVGSAEIVFGEADKAPFETPTQVFRPSSSTAFINLQLYGAQSFLNGGTASDGLRINFAAGESNAVLLNDAAKLGNIDENLASVNGDSYLSIENRALPVDGEVLSLYTDQYRHNNYTFKAEMVNLDENVTAYLKDDYLNIQTELPNGITTIDFSIDESIPASITTDRFSIIFSNQLSVDENETNGFTIYPNPTNGDFLIAAPELSGEKIQVSIYNILGQQVYSKEKEMGSNNRCPVRTKGFNAGIYMVKIIHQGKTFTEKLIVQ